jgi:hypothetical protein
MLILFAVNLYLIMKLKDILAISGKSGLFKFVSQGRNGIIVESFEDQKRTVVHSSAKVSALEDIAIFTDSEEVPLAEVFKKLFEKEAGKPTISHKASPDELKSLIESILPNYDKERVYVSDMKKLVHWYNQLLALNLINLEEESEPENKEEGSAEAKAVKSDHEAKDVHTGTEKKNIQKEVKKKVAAKTTVKSAAPKAAKLKTPQTKQK